MAINVDISKITGINQVGNSYQRKSAVPLDYYSLFNTKAEAEAYAASNPVSYVGQVISYIDNGEVKVCVIANAAGLLREVGTKPVGDGKTIEVSAEGAVALLGAASAANGTLPMLEEVEGKSKLVWKTLEQIGAGDGNDNTTYAFAFADQKITVTPSLNGVAQDAIEVDLSVFATEDEMATAIKEAIDNLPDDKDTTYTLSLSGMELTLTPSEGEAQKVTIDAYSKSEIDNKFTALPEDKDTTYSVKEGDKVLKLTGTEFATELDLVYENNRISLTGIDGEEIAGFDASVFVEDGVLQDVEYNAETRELTFAWNIVTGTDAEGNIIYKTDVVNIADLVDTYTAGNGLDLANNEFSVKLDSASEAFLTVGANGVKLSGVQSAIDAAKDAAIEDAKKYEAKADASAVYTKEEANALLADKANSADVYTKTATDTLLNAKANAADVYTKTEADNMLGAKANAADVYAKSETYTQKQVDDLLEGIQAGSSESAASVNTKLEALKKTLNNEIYGNDEGTGDSRIDTAEAKLAGIAEGAQVNVIESVAVTDAEKSRLIVSTVGKAVSIDDSGLRADITDAKTTATNAGTVASQAVQAAGENANKIQTNTNNIANLQTAVGTNTTDIAGLKAHDTEHVAQYNALNTLVGEHGTKIANLEGGKADKSVVEGVSAKATANEEAIKTLNETTIPGINGEIAKKADKTTLDSYYTKSESDEKFVVKESGKSLISDAEIARLANVDNYNDTEVRGLITDITKTDGVIDTKVKALADGAVAANAKAIDDLTKGAVANNTAAIAALKADENTAGSIAALIKVEADRAKGVEAGHEERIAEIETFFAAVEAPDATIDTLAEIIHYIESDKSGASEMAASIKANADAIAAINNADSGVLAQAKSYTNTEIAKLTDTSTGILAQANAHSDANLVTAKSYSDANLAIAKKYSDDSIAALQASIYGVDDDTIKLNENKAYVAKVSTDVLVQGSTELIFSAGNASGYNTTT